jgi:hypothetical protein
MWKLGIMSCDIKFQTKFTIHIEQHHIKAWKNVGIGKLDYRVLVSLKVITCKEGIDGWHP